MMELEDIVELDETTELLEVVLLELITEELLTELLLLELDEVVELDESDELLETSIAIPESVISVDCRSPVEQESSSADEECSYEESRSGSGPTMSVSEQAATHNKTKRTGANQTF